MSGIESSIPLLLPLLKITIRSVIGDVRFYTTQTENYHI